MKNTKFIQIISTFSEKELELFADFTISPIFNRNKKVLPLLAYFRKIFPQMTEKQLEATEIHRNCYPERIYDAAYLRKQFSSLYQLLQQFLVFQERQNQPFAEQRALLQQYNKRDLAHLFQLHYQSLLKEGKARKQQNSHYYFQQYQLASEADAFFGKQQKRRFDQSLQQKMDSFDAYYLIEKLKGCCEMLNRQKIVEGTYELNFVEEILAFLEAENSLSQIPMIQIYLQIVKTLRDENEEGHFAQLSHLLATHQNDFSQKEAAEMYRYAQNYCIRRINQGKTAYFRKLFDLFKMQLAAKINLPKGILSADDYKNIVTVGLRLGESDWVFQFLNTYKNALLPAFRDNVFNYNLATYYYATKDYDAAIQLLNTVDFTDIFYEISGKIMLAKTYFLQQEYEALFYLIDAFKLNLRRNKKVATSYKQSVTNFLIQLKKVAKLKADQGYLTKADFQQKFEKLEQRIGEIESIVDRGWLLGELRK